MTSPVGLERLHVLVVDDDTDLRETIAALLQEEGYLVSTASSGAQALGVLSPAPAPAPAVNVILFDLMMPESDGFDFRIKQRADDRIAHIPVIGMTGSMSLDPRIAEL
ncbi:MAG: hypothetical protein JWN04_241, partial [Myxococcaceae bacterium]|nr:hypothetical protein [Myxococcaceae bacterium]